MESGNLIESGSGFDTDLSAMSAGLERLEAFDMGSDDDDPIPQTLAFRTSPGPFHASRKHRTPSPSSKITPQNLSQIKSQNPLQNNNGSKSKGGSKTASKSVRSLEPLFGFTRGNDDSLLPVTPADRFQCDLLQETFDDSYASSPGPAANLFPKGVLANKALRQSPPPNQQDDMQTPPNVHTSPSKVASAKGQMHTNFSNLGLRQREQVLSLTFHCYVYTRYISSRTHLTHIALKYAAI